MPLIDRMLSKTPGIGGTETPRAPVLSASLAKPGSITEGVVGSAGAPSTAVSNLMKKAPDAILR